MVSNIQKTFSERQKSVVRLQSGLLRSDSQVPYRVGRSNSVSSSRPSRPRSLESDILLLR